MRGNVKFVLLVEEIIVGGDRKGIKKEDVSFPLVTLICIIWAAQQKIIYSKEQDSTPSIIPEKNMVIPLQMFWKGAIKQELARVMLMLYYPSFPTNTPRTTTAQKHRASGTSRLFA